MSADDFEMRSYEQPSVPALDGLKQRSRNGCVIGCFLLFSPVIFLLSIFALPTAAEFLFIPLLIVSFLLSMIGLVVLVLYGVGSNNALKAYEILQRLGPPDPYIGRKFVTKEYNGVYITGHTWGGMLTFVAFRGETGLITVSKMKVPGTMWKWESRIEVGDIKLYRREGAFAVPTERGDFISGEGVLYAETFVPSKYNFVVPSFTKEELDAIVERVSEDAKSMPMQ